MKKFVISLSMLFLFASSIISQKWKSFSGERDKISLWKFTYSFYINNNKLHPMSLYGIVVNKNSKQMNKKNKKRGVK